jgi:hypothetical protein
MEVPLNIISSESAIELITHGGVLRNCHIKGKLDLNEMEKKLGLDLLFENCSFENFNSIAIEFNHPIRFVGCRFYACSFYANYFIRGLNIENCVFESHLEFQAGGHNINGTLSIANSKFNGFVNFCDCWYQGNVVVVNNDFVKGTNLLGNKNAPCKIQFDAEPFIENNIGKIDMDGEGDITINTIHLKGF